MGHSGRVLLAVPLALSLGVASDRLSARPPPPDAFLPPKQIEVLRTHGRYTEALEMARGYEARVRATSGVPAWRKHDAQLFVGTIAKIASLPPEARRELAEADGASEVIERLASDDRFGEAFPIAIRQLEVRRRWLGSASVSVAASLHRVGRLEHALGQYEPALDHLAEAISIREAADGRDHVCVAESLELLGQVKKDVGLRLEEVMPYYQRALDIRGKAQGRDDPDLARTWMRIANLYRGRNRFAQAIPCFRRALRLRIRALGPNHPDVAVSHAELALALVASGDWNRAEPHARRAVEIQRSRERRVGQDYTLCLNNYATILAHRGRYAEAEKLLLESATAREEIRRHSLPGAGRSRMYSLAGHLDLASVQLALGKPERAWESLERAQGRGLIESARGAANTLGANPISLARVQAALARDEALIGWLDVRRGTSGVLSDAWGYVIRDHGAIHWERLACSPEDKTVAFGDTPRFVGELRAASSWPMRVTDLRAVSRLGRRLHDWRMRKLEPHLEGARRLIVISPDAMAGAPVESWVDERGRFVGERFVVSYSPSSAWHAWDQEHHASRRPPREWRALLVGAPEMDRRSPRQVASAHEMRETHGTADADFPLLPRTRAEVVQVRSLLPRSRVLLGPDAAEATLHHMAADGTLRGFDLIHFATHAFVEDLKPGDAALLLAQGDGGPLTAGSSRHASTTFAVPVEAAANVTDENDGDTHAAERDGFLRADEITRGWRLDAQLVSLSACQTGLGAPTRTEGFLGLTDAFLRTGARSLLVSLWNVDDTAQALLVARFYENLLGDARHPSRSKAEALHGAKEWLRTHRDAGGRTPFAHPSYWAGFVLIGDPS